MEDEVVNELEDDDEELEDDDEELEDDDNEELEDDDDELEDDDDELEDGDDDEEEPKEEDELEEEEDELEEEEEEDDDDELEEHWSSKTRDDLVKILTDTCVRKSLDDLELKAALLACMDKNLVHNSGLNVRPLEAFCYRFGLSELGHKRDIVKRLKAKAKELKGE